MLISSSQRVTPSTRPPLCSFMNLTTYEIYIYFRHFLSYPAHRFAERKRKAFFAAALVLLTAQLPPMERSYIKASNT